LINSKITLISIEKKERKARKNIFSLQLCAVLGTISEVKKNIR
jgi:hypothetical protein